MIIYFLNLFNLINYSGGVGVLPQESWFFEWLEKKLFKNNNLISQNFALKEKK